MKEQFYLLSCFVGASTTIHCCYLPLFRLERRLYYTYTNNELLKRAAVELMRTDTGHTFLLLNLHLLSPTPSQHTSTADQRNSQGQSNPTGARLSVRIVFDIVHRSNKRVERADGERFRRWRGRWRWWWMREGVHGQPRSSVTVMNYIVVHFLVSTILR